MRALLVYPMNALANDQLRPWLSCDSQHVFRIDDAVSFTANRLQQAIEFRLGVLVLLVERNNDRPALLHDRAQCFVFALGDIAVHDKNHQVGAPGDFLRQTLALLAPGLVEPGCVNQEYAAGLDLFPLLD